MPPTRRSLTPGILQGTGSPYNNLLVNTPSDLRTSAWRRHNIYIIGTSEIKVTTRNFPRLALSNHCTTAAYQCPRFPPPSPYRSFQLQVDIAPLRTVAGHLVPLFSRGFRERSWESEQRLASGDAKDLNPSTSRKYLLYLIYLLYCYSLAVSIKLWIWLPLHAAIDSTYSSFAEFASKLDGNDTNTSRNVQNDAPSFTLPARCDATACKLYTTNQTKTSTEKCCEEWHPTHLNATFSEPFSQGVELTPTTPPSREQWRPVASSDRAWRYGFAAPEFAAPDGGMI